MATVKPGKCKLIYFLLFSIIAKGDKQENTEMLNIIITVCLSKKVIAIIEKNSIKLEIAKIAKQIFSFRWLLISAAVLGFLFVAIVLMFMQILQT